jgi:WD40 repeat protein
MKKLFISLVLVFNISLYAIEDANSSLVINDTNINAKGESIVLSGLSDINQTIEAVFVYEQNIRITATTKSTLDGKWSFSYNSLNYDLKDGSYDIFVSSIDQNNTKSKISSKKSMIRDLSINGFLFFHNSDKNTSDIFINKKQMASYYISGQFDTDVHINHTKLYNIDDINNTLTIDKTKISIDKNGKVYIKHKDIPLNLLKDGKIILAISIEDDYNNTLIVEANIIKDTIAPNPPTVIKTIKYNNMINARVDNMLVYFGKAEAKSKIAIKIFNTKQPKIFTKTTVFTDQTLSWTLSGKNIKIDTIKNGNIKSVLYQIDEAGNYSSKLELKSIKEKNRIFPKKPQMIPDESYMLVETITSLEDIVKSTVVSKDFIITGSFELISFFDKNKGKLQKQIEIKNRWINKLLVLDNRLFIALNNGDIQIRDIYTNKLLKTLKDKKASLLNLIIDDTNSYLISSSTSGDIVVWNLKTYKKLYTLQKHQWDVSALVVKDNKLYTGSDDYSIKVWDLNSSKLIDSIKSAHKGTINSIVIYKNMLISASQDKTIKIRDLKTKRLIKVLKAHKREVGQLAINHDTLISSSKDRTIILWDLNTFTKIRQLKGHSKGIISLSVKDENIITTSLDYTLKIWGYDASLVGISDMDETTLQKYDLIRTITPNIDEITSISQTQNEIVVSTFGKIMFYNNVTYKYTRSYNTLDKVVTLEKTKKQTTNSEDDWEEDTTNKKQTDGWGEEDSNTEDSDESIFEQNLNKLKKQNELDAKTKPQWVNKINIIGTKLISGLQYKYIKIWDLQRDKAIYQIDGFDSAILDITNIDDKIVVSSSDGIIKIYNDEKMELINSIDAHQWGIKSIAISDFRLYSVSNDADIKVWDLETGDNIHTIKNAHEMDITKIIISDKYIITSSKDSDIQIRDKNNYKIITTLYNYGTAVNTMVADDENIIAGLENGEIKIWDIKTLKLIKTIKKAHYEDILSLFITNDYIISGGKDKKINIWKYYE